MANIGPLGQKRGVGFGILMFIITLGIYGLYWTYKTYEEMRRHTGEGLGGVVGLVIGLVIGVVNFYVIPSEIGKMYKKDGREPPVTGWTGLWGFPGLYLLLIGLFVWWFKVQGALNEYWDAKASEAMATT
jgi:hypothetical protein